ncbi:hypothetical protein DWX72_12955, partial [Ruminococcus sp. AF21-11]
YTLIVLYVSSFIIQDYFDNPQLENFIRKLHSQLQNVRGKKVYGYLPSNVKETVNNIFWELAKDENIRQLYEKWCSLERLKYKTYTQKEKVLPALTENKVFQPVRNMIIRTVLDMDSPMVDVVVQDPELIVHNIYDSDVEIYTSIDGKTHFGNAMIANTVIGLFVNLSRCIEEDYVQKYKPVKQMVDRKLRQMILKKKQELGVKEENNITMQ